MKFAFLAGLVALGLGCLGCFSAAFANPDDGTLPAKFVRGDTNNDGRRDISDAVFLLNFLFGGGDPPPCEEVGDINNDGGRDISDAVFFLRHLFLGGPQPPAPFHVCGDDPAGGRCVRSGCNA